VSLLELRDYLPGDTIQSGKQGGGAVANVVVRKALNTAYSQGQQGLDSIQSLNLNLNLLIDTKNKGIARWIKIEANNVSHILDGNGSVKSLKVSCLCVLI
jgi:hypothetical protein